MSQTAYNLGGRVYVARYRVDDGVIVGVPLCAEYLVPLMQELPGESTTPAWEGVADTTHFVYDGEIRERPACPAVLDGVALRDVPVPCVIHINHTPYEWDEDTVNLDIDQPGEYEVRVVAHPYRDGIYQVTVP